MAAPPRPEPAPPAQPAQPEPGACPRCGAPYEAAQEYCLDCGVRLPAPTSGVVGRLGGAWRRRLRWYPGDWIWVTLALLVVAAVGAAVAVASSRESEDASATLVATTTPGVTTGRPLRTTPPPAPPPPRQTTPATGAPPPPAARPRRTLIEWPAGRSGWTIVLRSDTERSTAVAEARRALRDGLRDVGVLDSSDYPSLHPGYFVVFAGVYTGQADAEAALDNAVSGGYERAYVRPVSP